MADCISLLLLLSWAGFVDSSHFRGAIITWQAFNEPNQVEISWRISWRRSYSGLTCTQDHIDNQQLVTGQGQLTCNRGCSGNISPMSFYCTDFSTAEDWSTGVNSVVYTASNDVFGVRFSGGDWIGGLVRGGGSWSLTASLNITQRSDTGRPNSSPRSASTPIVRLQHGCNHTLVIPTNDPDGDTVRCRWALGAEECAGVCNAFSNAQLEESTCTIQYEAVYQIGWYAVAIMIEDFANPLSSTPLSKIPLQFLVIVFTNDGPCSSAPEFVEPTPKPGACIGIPPNSSLSDRITAQTGDVDVSISAIETVSPIGFIKSPVGQVKGVSRQFYVNITWTPQLSQYGENIFCFTAEDSVGLSSEQQCITYVAGVAAPELVPDSIEPATGSEILSTHSTWLMKFDAEFVRPSKPTFIRFYTKGGVNVYSIDVASRSDVLYLSSLDQSVEFSSEGLDLQEKQTYYILLESGIATGLEFCGPESSAVRDPSFWSVRIKDTTPPVLQFTSNPSVSNDEIVITWEYNEASNSSCTVQAPDQTNEVVDCNLSWAGTNLTEGSYAIYISGTDEAGNVALPRVHSWRVDLTAPIVTISRRPSSPTNERSAGFQFACNERSCTYECSLVTEGESAVYTQCNSRTFMRTNLDDSTFYEFEVRATDQVGNRGLPASYKWYIDITPPEILAVDSATISCGQDFTPSTTGTPVVTDTYDSNPSLVYEDNPSDGCILERVWTAMDAAGNSASVTQLLIFSNPQPPVLQLPLSLLLPCGDPIEDPRSAKEFVIDGVLSHPCNRSMNVSYQDSVVQKLCGTTFTRYWSVVDDCENSVGFQQTIKILELQTPDHPQDGQVNINLYEIIRWPQYPASVEYRLYIWLEGNSSRPKLPTSVITFLTYQPSIPYTPNTKYLWQVEYVLDTETDSLLNVTVVPSPIWGFETRTFADFSMATVTIPPNAFSGQDLTVSWTVENIGSRGSTVSSWYDAIYLSLRPDFDNSARRVITQRRLIFLDPKDGYTSSGTIGLQQNTIGLYYVFVLTDYYHYIDDYDRSNNLKRSETPVDIRLTPPPDLRITDIALPETSYSGEEIEVIFTVRNSGNGVTATSRWYDAIFWSDDNVTSSSDSRLAIILHTNGLPPNAEYTIRHTVTVPRRIFGNFWVSVVTDVGNSVYEHVSEDNNGQITEVPINVLISPPPDLAIASFEVPSQAESATSIKLHWVVENEGFTETYESFWNDRVIMTSSSGDQSLVITTQAFSGRLAVSETYMRSFDFTMPSEYPNGIYDFTLYVDHYNHVFEHTFTSNNVDTKQVAVIQLLPDLVVEFVNASVSLNAANEESLLALFWRVRNTGDGKPGRREWVDRAFLSTSQIFSSASNIILGDVKHQISNIEDELSPDSSYVTTTTFNVAQTISGQMYVHIHADYRNALLEKNDDVADNQRSLVIDIPSRSSNLKVESAEILVDGISRIELYSGQEVVLHMNVSNIGNWATDKSVWTDTIRISRFSFVDNSARLLTSIEHNGKIFAGEIYNNIIDLILPDDLWGNLFLLFKVDDYDTLLQDNDGSERLLVLPVTLEVPASPEIRVTSLEYTLTTNTRRRRQVQGIGSRFLTVSWGVTNSGNSMVRYLTWKDAVVVSKEEGIITPPVGVLLKAFIVTGKLRTGQSYSISKRTVIIPDSVTGGSFFVYVIPDYYRELLSSTAELQPRPLFQVDTPLDIPERLRPDLKAVYVRGFQTEVFAGQYITLTFAGENRGGTTRVNSWIDSIYMDSRIHEDAVKPSSDALIVHQAHHIGSVSSDEQYQTQVQFQVPYSIRGSFDVFIHIDYFQSIDDSNMDNNYVKVPSGIEVLASPLPDLVVSAQESLTVRSGEPFSLKLNISNIGDASVNQTFYNAIYLSEDIDVDAFDTKILNTDLLLILDVNASEYMELEVFMPFDIPSAVYYVIAHIDSRNDVYEINNENNIAYALATIEEAYSTDIAVISVNPPPSPVAFNTDITIQWSLRNNGSENAIGYKCDTTYFSEDERWSIDDEQIGTLCNRVDLRPFDNDVNNDKSYSLSAPVPLITPKGYRTIVRSRSNIRDLNNGNNIGVAQSITHIAIDVLELDNPLEVTLTLNEQKVFRISNVIAEETLIFRLNSDTDTDFNELYARHENIASTGEYDVAGKEFLSPNQNAAIAKSKAGEYYVLIRKSGTSLSSEPRSYVSTVTLTAKYARLEVLEVTPMQAAPFGTVTLRISGTLFPEESRISLLDEDMRSINAIEVYHFTSLQVYATFNMSNQKVGSILSLHISDVYASNIATAFPDALTVVDGRPGTTSLRFDNPGRLLPSETGRITLFVQNVGDTDILTPMLRLDLDGDATFQVIEPSKSSNWTTTYDIYGSPEQGPGGILPPGGTSRVTFDIRPNSFVTSRVSFRVTELPPWDDIDNPYINQMNIFKPYEINTESWNRVWSHFLKATGLSQATLSERLSKTANQMSIIGRRIMAMDDMIQLQTKLADGFQSGNVLNRRTDLSLGGEDSGLHSAEIVRSYSPRLSHRNYVGSFGRGWNSPYLDTKLRKITIGYAVLDRGPETLLFPVVAFNLFELPFVGQIAVKEKEIIFIDAALSAKTFYHFDKGSYRLNSITNEFDRSALTFAYDDTTSRVSIITSSLGSTLEFEYNSRQLVEGVSLNGKDMITQRSRYTYDNNFEYLMAVDVDDITLQYTYTLDGALESVRQSDGVRLNYMYDDDGLFAGSRTYNPLSEKENTISFDHDGSGRIKSFETPSNDTTVYIYDENSNLGYVKTLGTLSHRFLRNYQDGSKTTMIGDQVLTAESYDVVTDTLTIVDANGATTSLGLQPNGDINFIRDGLDNIRTASYKQDLLANVTFADGSKEEYLYDNDGTLTSFKTRKGDMITFESDENGNVVKKDIPDKEPTYYLYDHRGFVVEATNEIGKIVIDYTESGLPLMVEYPNGRVLVYRYDDSSRRTGLYDNMGYNVTYVYDNKGNLADVIDNSKSIQVLNVELDSLGRVLRRGTGNGCSTAYEYETRGKKIKSLKTSCSNTGNVLDIDYGFDSRNRLNEMNSTFGNWRYRYDAASQVTAWVDPTGKETQILYDKARNRRVLSQGGMDVAYTVNNLNQYLTFDNDVEFKHDLNGNLVEVINQAEGDAERYVFGADNQLLGFATSEQDCSFSYDALGNLYQKNCAGKITTYLVDPFGYFGADTIAEIDEADDAVYYIHASYHGLVAMVPSNNTGIYYYHYDALGSVLGVTDDQQTLQNNYQYDPFGNVIASEENVPNAYQFIGQWGVSRVRESPGLYFMRARFYDSRHGRFLTLDPYGISGKSTNLYSYANNNPLENIDPKGTALPWLVGGIVGAIVNTGYYAIEKVVSGDYDKITLGGLAGAATSGAIGGVLAFTPLGLTGSILVGAAGSATGSVVGSTIDGTDVDYGQLVQQSLVSGLTALIPIKPALFSSTDALLDAVTKKTLKENLLGRPGLSMVLNGIAGGIKGTTATKLVDTILAGVEHAWPIVKEAFENGVDNAIDRLDDFKDIANDLVNDAGSFADDIGSTISDAVGDITDRVGQGIEKIANDVSNAGTDILNTIDDTFEDIQGTIGETADTISNSLQEGFQDSSNSLENAGSDIKDTLTNTLDELGNSASNGYDGIKDSIKDAYDDISDSVGSGAGDVGDILNDAIGDLLDANSFDDAKNSIGDAIEDISDTIGETVDSITDTAGNAINDIKDTVSETLDDFKESLGEAANDVKETVTETVEDLSDIASETWEDIKDAASDAFEDISDTASEGIDSISETIGDTYDKIKDDVSEAVDDIGDIVDNAAERVDEALDDLLDDIGDAADDVGNLLDEIYEDIKEGAKKFWDDLLDWPRSKDPNDIIGPAGYGDARFVPVDVVLSYKIRFENDVNATAPAQRVFVVTTLDDDLDIRTLRVGSYGFGNFTQEVTNPSAFLQKNLDLVETVGVYVRVRAGLDVLTQQVTWELLTIDPETGQQPTDPSVGFLPPNSENGTDGQGYVTFNVKAKRNSPDLSVIDAKARIIFDQNDPIDTPPIFNTIDAGLPSVNMTIVEETLPSGILAVRLQKHDSASGVKNVDVLMNTALGNEIVAEGTVDSIVTLDLPMGETYNLIAVPIDNVGNQPQIAAIFSNSVVEVFFPEIEFSCNMVGNCSGFGTCIGENLCDCFAGRYGDACETDIAPVEPPIIGFQPTESTEDSSISISVSIRTADTNPDSYTVVLIRNVPPGATLNHGDLIGEVWYVPLEFLPELVLIPPPEFDGTINLLLVATTTSPTGNATREIPLPLTLKAVADPVTLDVQPTCYLADKNRFPLNIKATGNDLDGSENVTLIISNVPENVTIIPAHYLGYGQYLVRNEDVQLLEIEIELEVPFPLLILDLTVRSTEISNGDMWEQTTDVVIAQCSETATGTPETPGQSDATTLYVIIAVCCVIVLIVILIVVCVLYVRNKNGKVPDDQEIANTEPQIAETFDNPTYTSTKATAVAEPSMEPNLEMAEASDVAENQDLTETPSDTKL